MDRRAAALLLVAVVALASVVNATVFAYRWLSGTVSIEGADKARGAACTGFYSAADQSGITQFLPNLGTNYNAPTYGTTYSITVTPGAVVCQWTTASGTYKLYEGITVTIPVTVGSWYIQDFYAFGYNGTGTTPTVHVYFRVEDTAEYVTTAKLIIWKGTTRVELDLLSLGAMTSVISLSPCDALRLDLYLNASTTGTATFRVGVYVTQESGESPSP